MPQLAPTPPRLSRVNLADRERDAALAKGRSLLEAAARKGRVLGVYQGRREVPEAARLRTLDRLRVEAQKATRGLTQRLLDGQLSRSEWQRQMRDRLVPAHYAAALAATGSTRLSPAALAEVQAQIRTQLGYLSRFRTDIATGKIDGRILARSDLYGAAVWSTGQAAKAVQAKREGNTEERGILGAMDNCDSCLDRESQGWQPIGSLLPIGAGICRSRCKCHLEYRGARAGLPQDVGIGGLADGQRFVRPPGAEDGRRYAVVLADVSKLDDSLKKDSNFYVGPGGSGAGIAGRYGEAKKFLEKAVRESIPIQMSRSGLSDATGGTEAFIGDGRHRFAVLRDSGARAVPVVVPVGDRDRFRSKFGYRRI